MSELLSTENAEQKQQLPTTTDWADLRGFTRIENQEFCFGFIRVNPFNPCKSFVVGSCFCSAFSVVKKGSVGNAGPATIGFS